MKEEFPGYDVELYPLSLSVGCHIGPNAIGVACVEEIVWFKFIELRIDRSREENFHTYFSFLLRLFMSKA